MLSSIIIGFITFINFFAIVLLGCAIINENKYNNKLFIQISYIYIIYLIISYLLLYSLKLPIGLGILIYILFSIISIIIYIVAIIINISKIRNKKNNKNYVNKFAKYFILILELLPICIVSLAILRDIYIIHNSEVILIYNAKRDHQIGDYDDFAFAINGNNCKEIELGISNHGYYSTNFTPKNSVVLNSLNNIPNYKVYLNENSNTLTVYKEDKKVCTLKYNSRYYNNELEKIIYIKKNKL